MKRFSAIVIAALVSLQMMAQGWPSNYGGVMLQGFYWDSFGATTWAQLEKQTNNFKGYFDLVWVPQSGKAAGNPSMGYDPMYFFDQNSSFGSEAQLRSMIKTFKQAGIGTIADVVINHHGTTSTLVFPKETYKGVTYQLTPADIVADDDIASTAASMGISLSSNKDEGEGWAGMPDLDHKSQNVQKIVKAYEKYLVDDLGYTGFRYDMVKGFAGSHVGDYNEAAGVEYSVGECWDSNQTIENWIDATGKRSAAFDFQFRYNVRDAINNSSWTANLNSTNNLVHDANYRQYAVTFVENHDTERRSNAEQDPIKADTLAANAYMLAMPGTPCVFYKHYVAYPTEIKAMIDARKMAGVTNTSNYQKVLGTTAFHCVATTGTKGTLVARVGTSSYANPDASTYTRVLSGYHYSYFLSRSMETPFVDKPSGSYDAAFDVTLTAVSANDNAQLVYTTDGTTPTASSTKVASGSKVNISKSCTLTVGLLVGGTVGKTITRQYTIETFKPYTINIYVNADNAGSAWSTWTSGINIYSWDADGQEKAWPGTKVVPTETIGGKKWAKRTYTIAKKDAVRNFVFSVGTGTPQTVDVTTVTSDAYFEVSSTLSGAKYTVNDVTSTYTGIALPTVGTNKNQDNRWFTLQGIEIKQPTQKGVYIHNGKKIILR